MNNSIIYNGFVPCTYASIWKRFCAYVIDTIFLIILTVLTFQMIKVLTFFAGGLLPSEFVERSAFYFYISIYLLWSWGYFTGLPVTSFGSTFGQLFMGLRQTNSKGDLITYKQSNLKYFSSIFSKIFYIGYILSYFNVYHQTFHEMFTDCFLIER